MSLSLSRTAVVGAGAVGCYFGGMLARAGVPVTVIGRATHMDAINRNGLLIDGLQFHERISISASTDLAAVRDARLVLFCVKTTDTESAARALTPHLHRDALVISMQNGVDNVDRIHMSSGIRALPAVVYVAAAMTAPGEVKHSGRGDLIIGNPSTSPSHADLQAIAALFERTAVPCRISADIRTDLWTKMLMNCAYNAISALARERYGRILASAEARELMRAIIEECIAIAAAEGVTLDAGAMTAAAFQLGEAMSGALSSTGQDIERGKLTEIDSLNGYIVRQGVRHGIAVPVNRTLHTVVKLREASATRA